MGDAARQQSIVSIVGSATNVNIQLVSHDRGNGALGCEYAVDIQRTIIGNVGDSGIGERHDVPVAAHDRGGAGGIAAVVRTGRLA